MYAFDVPGTPEDKISIELADNALTVSGERERTHEVSDDRFTNDAKGGTSRPSSLHGQG